MAMVASLHQMDSNCWFQSNVFSNLIFCQLTNGLSRWLWGCGWTKITSCWFLQQQTPNFLQQMCSSRFPAGPVASWSCCGLTSPRWQVVLHNRSPCEVLGVLHARPLRVSAVDGLAVMASCAPEPLASTPEVLMWTGPAGPQFQPKTQARQEKKKSFSFKNGGKTTKL